MLLRKSPFSKKLTSDEIEAKLKDVVSCDFECFVVCIHKICFFCDTIVYCSLHVLQLLVLKYVDNKDVFMRYV
jgi:hypothetical protein